MEVVVIRHGETDWNAEGRIQGHQESDLNARGKRQARAVGERFRGDSAVALYSSDLRRTMDTARRVAEATGLEIRPDARLREWHLGCIETMLLSEARDREPAATRIYDERDTDTVVPGGESIRQRYARCTSCLEEISESHKGERVVVVTHGGILDDFYRFANGVALEVACEWDLFNCGINVLKHKDGAWLVDVWGDITHLDGIGAMADWGGEGSRMVDRNHHR
jgi:probable phosphoglycerate mutase